MYIPWDSCKKIGFFLCPEMFVLRTHRQCSWNGRQLWSFVGQCLTTGLWIAFAGMSRVQELMSKDLGAINHGPGWVMLGWDLELGQRVRAGLMRGWDRARLGIGPSPTIYISPALTNPDYASEAPRNSFRNTHSHTLPEKTLIQKTSGEAWEWLFL